MLTVLAKDKILLYAGAEDNILLPLPTQIQMSKQSAVSSTNISITICLLTDLAPAPNPLSYILLSAGNIQLVSTHSTDCNTLDRYTKGLRGEHGIATLSVLY